MASALFEATRYHHSAGYKMNIKHKEWIKILLFLHLITAGLLGPTIIIFWVDGFIGLYSAINVFSELGRLKYYIYIGLPLIFAVLSLGLYGRAAAAAAHPVRCRGRRAGTATGAADPAIP